MATAHAPVAPARDADWERAARMAVLLSWASLFYMGIEGGVGVWQGVAAGSIALAGWGLASFIEGVASAIIVWRFTGTRRLSDTAEGRAQRLVAVQFFILAPYVLVQSARTLLQGGHAEVTVIGMALTATSVVLMPLLGTAKHRLAARLGSAASGWARRRPPARARRTSCVASRPRPCSRAWPPTPRSAPGGSTR